MKRALLFSGLVLFCFLCLTVTESGRTVLADKSVGASQWYLPAGGTEISNINFDTYVLISNPGDEPAVVEVKFVDVSGLVGRFSDTIPPADCLTVKMSNYVGKDRPAVSTIVKSLNNVPIMCGWAMDWGSVSGNWQSGHSPIGIREPAAEWRLPEGSTRLFKQFVHVLNPNDSAVKAVAVFTNQDGLTWQTEAWVKAQANWTINVNEVVGEGQERISTQVTADGGLVAVDRTMYWPRISLAAREGGW